MPLLDILKRRGVKDAEQIIADAEAERPVSPWWNSRERWEWEMRGRKR
jgi:hypothetical protein